MRTPYTRIGLSLIILLFSTGCIWKSKHEKIVAGLNTKIKGLQKEKGDLQSQLDTRTADLKKMTTRRNRLAKIRINLTARLRRVTKLRTQCLTDLKQLANKGGKLSQRLSQAIDQIQRLQAIADKRKALFDKLRASFQSMVDAGKLRVKMVNGMLVLQLAEKILFASGKYKLKSEGKDAIKQVATLLKDMKRRWQVTGHTDSKGTPAVNWNLSIRRAMAVLKVMLKEGMPPEYISAAGFGQYQPTAPNDTPENRSLNRRTEIALIPNLKELQLAQAPSPFWACKVAARRVRRVSKM